MERLNTASSLETCLILRDDDIHLTDVLQDVIKSTPTNIFILTRGTFLIDGNLKDTEGNICNLLICAKKIVVLGDPETQVIFIRGKDGKSFKNEENERGGKNSEFDRNGVNGGDGGPGGNIYLVCEEKSELNHLKVVSRGGNGGNGQDGLNGQDDGGFTCQFYKQILNNFEEFKKMITKLCDEIGFEKPNWTDPDFLDEKKFFLEISNPKVYHEIEKRCAILAAISVVIQNAENEEPYNTCVCHVLQELFEKEDGIPDIDKSFFKSCYQKCPKTNGIVTCSVGNLIKEKKISFSELESQYKREDWEGNRFWLNGANNVKNLKTHRGGISPVLDQKLMLEDCNHLRFLCSMLSIKTSKINPTNTMSEGVNNMMEILEAGILTSSTAGGIGGNGGAGGSPGNILIFTPNEPDSRPEVERTTGDSGIGGKGGRGGMKQAVESEEVKYEDKGDDGDGGSAPPEQDNLKWDPHNLCNLSDFTKSLDLPQRDLLISILTSHKWTLENVLDTKFFVDECLSHIRPKEISFSVTPFSKSYLENVLQFQDHLNSYNEANPDVAGIDPVFQFVLASNYCRAMNLKRFLEFPPLVTNLEKKLDLMKSKLSKIKEAKLDYIYTHYLSEYKESLKSKIHKEIETTQLAITSCLAELDETFSSLLESLRAELKETVTILKEQGAWKRGGLITKIVGTLASLAALALIPDGGATSRGIMGVTGAVEEAVKEMTPVHQAAISLQGSELRNPSTFFKEKVKSVESQIELLENSIRVGELGPEFKKALKDLRDLKTKLLTCKEKKKENYQKLLDECTVKLKKKREEILKITMTALISSPDPKSKKYEVLITLIVTFTIKDPTDAKLFKTKDDSLLKKIKEKFIGDTKEVSLARQREDLIKNTFEPFIKNLRTLANTQFGGTQKSTIPKWKLEDILTQVKTFLRHFVAGFSAEDELKLGLGRIERIMEMHFNLWKSIDEYEESKERIDWKTKMTGVLEEFEGNSSADLKTKAKALKVDFDTKAEMLLLEYEIIKRAFLQRVFPHADIYLEEVRGKLEEDYILAEVDVNDVQKTKDALGKHADRCINVINHFTTVYNDPLSQTTKLDEKYIEHKFDNEPPNQPLWKWSQSEFNAEIKKFLSGQPTKFYAPVMPKESEKAAIKINKNLKLKYSFARKKDHDEFQKALENLWLDMIHSGTSLYRVGSDFYVIRDSEPISLTEDAGDQNTSINLRKSRMDDHCLSPSTEWTFQFRLAHPNNYNENEKMKFFEDLAKNFGSCVDLQLVGTAKCLDESKSSDDTFSNLENYYEKVEPGSELHNLYCTAKMSCDTGRKGPRQYCLFTLIFIGLVCLYLYLYFH